MRVAVIGSRKFTDYERLKTGLHGQGITHIVSGGAVGTDTLAQVYARRQGIPITIYYPDYFGFGKKAPLVRNEHIVKDCEKLIAFWDGESRGTKYTIDLARKRGTPVDVIIVGAKSIYD